MANEGNETERGFLTRWLLHYADFLHQTKLLSWRFYIMDFVTSTDKICNLHFCKRSFQNNLYLIRVHSKQQSASQFASHCTALEQKFRNDVNRCRIAPEQNHCSRANFWNDVLSVRCSLGCNSLLQSKIT